MKIVAITSCPVGIAHTYMVASKLKKTAKKFGIDIKVETQGQLGPENVISVKEFEDADAIVLACGVRPLNPERWEKCKDKVVNLPYSEVLKKEDLLIAELKKANLF